ncbi:MAG: hypothetical protein BWY09_02901 [Candidatus Hydrogenedentes bacterium ADurb.Bin179]|nr:MAG: hypothetical protein BWY09_02901 [Candidatus Hydrogenedentes bacterium ADurb.Bin179]
MNIAECIHGDYVPPFKMRVKTAWERYRYLSFWQKEPETIAWIRSFADGDCLYDVGANIGMYSLYACTLFPNSGVWAFEPQWSNYMAATLNATLNGFGRLWVLFEGVSDRSGYARFEHKNFEPGSSGGQIGSKGGFVVRITSLDDFAAQNGPPDHIKIDIDGQEAKVIEGMKGLIANRTFKSCLIEMGKTGEEAQRIRQTFLVNGYTDKNVFNTTPEHSKFKPWRSGENVNIENVVFTRLP